jgi:uncharacterized membrane protein
VYWKLFLISIPVFLVIDLLWLGLVARGFYDEQLGDLRAPKTNWVAAIVFYAVFLLGLVFFVVQPAVDAASWADALFRGAFFGFVAYVTYDLTNLAVIRDWPLPMTLVDIAWGAVLAGSVSVITYRIGVAVGV